MHRLCVTENIAQKCRHWARMHIAPIQRFPNACPANIIITYMGLAKCFLTNSCLALAMRGVFVNFVALLTRNAVAKRGANLVWMRKYCTQLSTTYGIPLHIRLTTIFRSTMSDEHRVCVSCLYTIWSQHKTEKCLWNNIKYVVVMCSPK